MTNLTLHLSLSNGQSAKIFGDQQKLDEIIAKIDAAQTQGESYMAVDEFMFGVPGKVSMLAVVGWTVLNSQPF